MEFLSTIMDFWSSLTIDRELIPNLLAILGLLMTWELHDLEVRAGRIKPRDIFDLLGRRSRRLSDAAGAMATELKDLDIRLERVKPLEIFDVSSVQCWIKSYASVHMYIQVTPNDSQACPTCRQASGKVFSVAARKNKRFRPLEGPCANPTGCRCQLIGLIGNWPEGEELWRSLDDSPQGLALSDDELTDLLHGAREAPRGTTQDRVNLYMLEAMHAESANPVFAMSRYRSLIRRAAEGYDHPFTAPGYLRLSDLLERNGNFSAALSVVDDFIKLTQAKKFLCGPTQIQSKTMALRRARLLKLLKTA